MKRSYMFRMFYFVMRAGQTDEINKYKVTSILKIIKISWQNIDDIPGTIGCNADVDLKRGIWRLPLLFPR